MDMFYLPNKLNTQQVTLTQKTIRLDPSLRPDASVG